MQRKGRCKCAAQRQMEYMPASASTGLSFPRIDQEGTRSADPRISDGDASPTGSSTPVCWRQCFRRKCRRVRLRPERYGEPADRAATPLARLSQLGQAGGEFWGWEGAKSESVQRCGFEIRL